MRHNLALDPAVVRIAAELELDEFSVVGRLHALWSWLDQHSTDGQDVPVTAAFLDRLTGCAGFAAALQNAGWLAISAGSVSFPGYSEHNGGTAKARCQDSSRKARSRGADGSAEACPARNRTKAGTEKRRGEKKREVCVEGHTPTPFGEPGKAGKTEEPAAAAVESSPCSVEEARAEALALGVSEEAAEHWWHLRERGGWRVGESARRIANWRSDLKTSASWAQERVDREKSRSACGGHGGAGGSGTRYVEVSL
ncbi:MAG: hypothetical protein JWO82_192 [Akkermansiaceae bacterium]|nr:hypothetical protein [Akkermansiaceae bacterium]